MAIGERKVRLGLAAGIAIVAVGFGVGGFFGGSIGHAAVTITPNPDKNCTGHNGSATVPPVPGDTVTCTVYFNGTMEVLSGANVIPATGTTITGCGGGPNMFTDGAGNPYTVTGAQVGNQCGYTINTAGGMLNPLMQVIGVPAQNGGLGTQLGTETFTIPSTTAVPSGGKSLMQMANFCQVEATPSTCGPTTPMGEGGAGTCVGGAAAPFPVGGCSSGLPAPGTPTPPGGGGGTPTPSSSSSESNNSEAGETSSSGVQGVTATKFTGADEHPLPIGAGAIAFGGLLLAFGVGAGPSILRKRRGNRSN